MKFGFLVLLFLVPNLAAAESEGFVLKCPKNYFQSEDWCADFRGAEVNLASVRDSEGAENEEIFFRSQNQILRDFGEKMDRVLADNQSSPHFLAQKAVHELRLHDQCLREMCDQILAECAAQDFAGTRVNDQIEFCRRASEKIIAIETRRLQWSLHRNQIRKETSLLRQKLVALSARTADFLHRPSSAILNDLVRFSGKLTNFTRSVKK